MTLRLIVILVILCITPFVVNAQPGPQQCNDRAALVAIGITENCTNLSQGIITCDGSNNVIGINIPAGFKFANTQFRNLKLNCMTHLLTFSVPSATNNSLTGPLGSLPSVIQSVTVDYQQLNSIDPSISSLRFLSRLEVSYNKGGLDISVNPFNGPGTFPSLTTLVLRGNSISNLAFTLPFFDITFADVLPPTLTYLDLTTNLLSGAVPSPILVLTKLQTLYLGNNSLSGSLSAFASLTSLTTLDISFNAFTGPIPNLSPLLLTTFNYAGNNLDVGIAGNLKVQAIQVSSSFGVELTGNPNGYSPSGAVSIDTVNGWNTQLALSGPQFSGLNSGGTKLLINNFYGANVLLIQAVNSIGNCDFSLMASGPGQPASFTIAGGATFFTTPVDGHSCSQFAPRILVGLSGQIAGTCGFCHSAIYPGADSFNYLGTSKRRWNSIYANQAYANAYNTLSDARAKENLEPLTNALEKLKTLDAYYYNLKQKHEGHHNVAGKTKTIGLLSQQVQKVFPEVVKEDGGFLHLDYSKLVAVLVESTKELAQQVDKQETTISQLSETAKTQQKQIESLTALVSSLASSSANQEALIKKLMDKN